ncbi:MAG: nitroreductase family protein [Paludibacteraceae bacterium]|nr:nitroreductase family protein [Paludibacteraceae bacterium]MBR1480654.1 nitroreductase family protein [Paludibacteraceae bacterium]
MQNFQELCRLRRSIRKYTEEPLTQEQLDYILRCALMSPSGKRINPWRFVVVTDRAVLRRMAGCRTYGSQMFDTAAAGIVVALDASLTDTWQCDGAIAAQNMLLAAADLGLGACWCQVYGREGAEQLIREAAAVPEGLTILCVVSLGHPDEQRRSYDFDKLQYDKVIQSNI